MVLQFATASLSELRLLIMTLCKATGGKIWAQQGQIIFQALRAIIKNTTEAHF